MGSLGASTVNDVIVDALPKFKNKDYQVLFVTGKEYYEKVKDLKTSKNVKIVPYVEGLSGLMKDTTLMVTRAGASTLSEILSFIEEDRN